VIDAGDSYTPHPMDAAFIPSSSFTPQIDIEDERAASPPEEEAKP
jgi:hypothetical protein